MFQKAPGSCTAWKEFQLQKLMYCEKAVWVRFLFLTPSLLNFQKITALKQEIAPLVKKLEPYNHLSPVRNPEVFCCAPGHKHFTINDNYSKDFLNDLRCTCRDAMKKKQVKTNCNTSSLHNEVVKCWPVSRCSHSHWKWFIYTFILFWMLCENRSKDVIFALVTE